MPGLEEPVPFPSQGGVQAAMAAWRTLTPFWPGLIRDATCRNGAGRGTETSCLLASEQRFFNFRVMHEMGLSGASGAQVIENGTKKVLGSLSMGLSTGASCAARTHIANPAGS